jgi:hypothetical protein
VFRIACISVVVFMRGTEQSSERRAEKWSWSLFSLIVHFSAKARLVMPVPVPLADLQCDFARAACADRPSLNATDRHNTACRAGREYLIGTTQFVCENEPHFGWNTELGCDLKHRPPRNAFKHADTGRR